MYLEKFGVRSEINCYVSEKDAGPTGEVQQQLCGFDPKAREPALGAATVRER